jgi:superfamily II RNA helicase
MSRKVSIYNGPIDMPLNPVITFPYEPDNCQKHAFHAIERGDDMLLCWPTGVGKTTPAVYAILHTIKNLKKKVVYTTPIKSLSNEKYNEFTKLFGEYGISVGILTGDNKINPNADCIIATAEILRNSLFQTTKIQNTNYRLDDDFVKSIGCVIMDEIHYMNDKERGNVWESTIIRLASNIQLIMLSGTIGNPNKFCKWITRCRNTDIALIIETKRVVPLTHHFFINKKSFQYLDQDNVYSSVNFMLAKNEYDKKKKERQKVHKQNDEQADITSMIYHLKNNDLLPAIFFAFSRRECEKNATIVNNAINIDFLTIEEKNRSNYLFQKYIGSQKIKYQNISEIDKMHGLLQLGIAYHHSFVLQNLRELIEMLMKEKLIKILFATETLCIGVNVPAKTCVFTGLYKYTNSGRRTIYSSEYRQMAGRAGRRGMDMFGIVYFLPLYDMPYDEEMKSVINSVNQDIKSNFRLDYQFMLRFSQIEDLDVIDFFNRSLLNFENVEQIELLEIEKQKSESHFAKIIEESNNIASTDSELESISKLIYYDDKAKKNITLTKSQDKLKKEIKIIVNQNANIKKKYELLLMQQNLQEKIETIMKNLDNYKNYIKTMYTNYQKVLIDWQYVLPKTDSNLLIQKKDITVRGIVCSQINECNVILLTEMICDKYFNGLSSQEIIALLSIFTDPVQREQMCDAHDFNGTHNLHNCISNLQNLVKECDITEKIYIPELERVNYVLCTDYIDMAYDWGNGKTVHEMLGYFEEYEIPAEAFCKNMTKISNIILSMINIYKMINQDIELIPKLEEANRLILRDIVCVTSLYLQ